MQWCRWYLFVTLSQLQWPVARSKVNLTLDLAIVYVSQHWPDQTNKFKECTKLLPKEIFNFNEALTRIAVVGREGGEDGWKVITPGGLTSNEAEFEQSVSKMTNIYQSGITDFQKPLELVRAEVFTGPAAIGRTSFVVMITTNDEKTSIGARTVAGELRGFGVGIYVITQRGNKEELSNLTGDPQKVDVHDHLATTMYEAFQILPSVTASHACKYEDACFFAAQNMACSKDHWTRGVPTDVLDCAANGFPPDQTPAGGQCQRENCSNTCNWLWPLEKEPPSCTDKTCGSKLDIPRAGPMRWKQLEYCPRSIECPACPPTTAQPTSAQSTSAHPTSAPVVVVTTESASGLPDWGIALLVVLGIVLAIGVAAVVGMVFMKKKKGAGKAVGKGKSEGKAKSEGKGQMGTKGSKKEATAGSAHDKIKSVTSPPVPVKGKGKGTK